LAAAHRTVGGCLGACWLPTVRSAPAGWLLPTRWPASWLLPGCLLAAHRTVGCCWLAAAYPLACGLAAAWAGGLLVTAGGAGRHGLGTVYWARAHWLGWLAGWAGWATGLAAGWAGGLLATAGGAGRHGLGTAYWARAHWLGWLAGWAGWATGLAAGWAGGLLATVGGAGRHGLGTAYWAGSHWLAGLAGWLAGWTWAGLERCWRAAGVAREGWGARAPWFRRPGGGCQVEALGAPRGPIYFCGVHPLDLWVRTSGPGPQGKEVRFRQFRGVVGLKR
jgi:hypothetical protein